jgi:hypothetical protein
LPILHDEINLACATTVVAGDELKAARLKKASRERLRLSALGLARHSLT